MISAGLPAIPPRKPDVDAMAMRAGNDGLERRCELDWSRFSHGSSGEGRTGITYAAIQSRDPVHFDDMRDHAGHILPRTVMGLCLESDLANVSGPIVFTLAAHLLFTLTRAPSVSSWLYGENVSGLTQIQGMRHRRSEAACTSTKPQRARGKRREGVSEEDADSFVFRRIEGDTEGAALPIDGRYRDLREILS
nr:hypothetical protein CFP56_57633 [Quercus suber]